MIEPQFHANAVSLTCLSGSIEANPPALDCPPFEAAACTSSLGRLAKLPGLELSAMVLGWYVWIVYDSIVASGSLRGCGDGD